MRENVKIGDKVICFESGVVGTVVKKYFPTACEEQTMIKTADGRLYHAPTRTFQKYQNGIIAKQTIIDVILRGYNERVEKVK